MIKNIKNVSLKEHYKDRDPLQTVNLIKTFFENKGFLINHETMETNIGTWGSVVYLYKKNKLIVSTNGKGMSEDYCLASGYGELYERYCNLYKFNYFNPFVMDKRYKLYNYYYEIGEKELNYEEIIKDKNLYDYLNQYTLSEKNQKLFLKVINNNTNGSIIGLPFQNLLDKNDYNYYNINLLFSYTGTTGMCAGNTLEEAENQGISELFERICVDRLIKENYNLILHELDLNKIENKDLQEKIKKIQEKNYIKIYDLSYNFNLPVVAMVLFNYETGQFTTNPTSFPVFEIALERTITESFQNIQDWDLLPREELQLPFDKGDYDEMIFDMNKGTIQHYVPEFISKAKTIVTTYNKNVFLSGEYNYSNEYLNNYIKDICKKNNLDIYVANTSLIDDIYALYIYTPMYTYFRADKKYLKSFEMNSINQFNIYNLVQKTYDILKNIYIKKKIEAEDIYFFDEYISILSDKEFDYYNFILAPEAAVTNFFKGGETSFLVEGILKILNKKSNLSIYKSFFETAFQKNAYFYLTIREYIKQGIDFYSIKTLFEKYNFNITEETYTELAKNNIIYLLNKLFVEPYVQKVEKLLEGDINV